MRKPKFTSKVIDQRAQWRQCRSIISFILLLGSLILAGSVDAALKPANAETSFAAKQAKQPLFATMLKHALVAYASGDYTIAYNHLLPLAQQDVVDAQYYLATLYDDGRGVESNPAMAAFWYRRAAKLGHVNAQYNIGVAHANGDGVLRNTVDAVRWWRVAAVSGSVNAQFNLGIMYLRGEGIRHDPAEAVRWWIKAAKQGDPAAQYNLGALYVNGEGVSRDINAALGWWTRAAAQGFQQAIVALRDFHLPEQGKTP